MTNRKQRYKVFEDCQEIIKLSFKKLANQSLAGKYLIDNFGLEFNKNKTDTEGSFSVYSIKWKDRPFDLDSNDKSLTETGAEMVIRQSVLGYVSIILHPASTTFSRQPEDFVIIMHRLKPSWLCCKVVVNLLWRIFLAYSTTTSIDTTPSFCSRAFIRVLRYIRPKCVNGIILETSFLRDVKWFFAFGFTLVTSSLFVYYMQSKKSEEEIAAQSSFYHKMDSVVTETNAIINKKTEKIGEKLDTITLTHYHLLIKIHALNNKRKNK